MINTGSSGQFFSLLNNRFFVICQQFLFLMVWGVSFRLCPEHPVQAFRLCPTPFFEKRGVRESIGTRSVVGNLAGMIKHITFFSIR